MSKYAKIYVAKLDSYRITVLLKYVRHFFQQLKASCTDSTVGTACPDCTVCRVGVVGPVAMSCQDRRACLVGIVCFIEIFGPVVGLSIDSEISGCKDELILENERQIIVIYT